MDQHPDFKSILLTRHGANETICVSAYKVVNGEFIVSERFCHGVDEAANLIERSYQREDIGAIWTNIQRLKPGSSRRKKGETIDAYTNIVIDIDRKIKKDADGNKVNATDEERVVLREAAEEVHKLLAKYFGAAVFADSGNGYHLSWRCEPLEPEEGQDFYRQLLAALSAKFERDGLNMEIDLSLADDTQVVTVWGTWNRKYADTLDRPQRQSKALLLPPQKPITRTDILLAIVENEAPAAAHKLTTKKSAKTDKLKANPEWLEEYGVPDLIDFWSGHIAYESDSYDKDGDTHHPIAPCPCHESENLHEHSHAKDCEIIEFADGGIGIACFSRDYGLKSVIAKMNRIVGEKYPHMVYAEESMDELLEEFGAKKTETAQEQKEWNEKSCAETAAKLETQQEISKELFSGGKLQYPELAFPRAEVLYPGSNLESLVSHACKGGDGKPDVLDPGLVTEAILTLASGLPYEDEMLETRLSRYSVLLAVSRGGKGMAWKRAAQTLGVRDGQDFQRYSPSGHVQMIYQLGDRYEGKKPNQTHIPGPRKMIWITEELSGCLKMAASDGSKIMQQLLEFYDNNLFSHTDTKTGRQCKMDCRLSWGTCLAIGYGNIEERKFAGTFTDVSNDGLIGRMFFGFSEREVDARELEGWGPPTVEVTSTEIAGMGLVENYGERMGTRIASHVVQAYDAGVFEAYRAYEMPPGSEFPGWQYALKKNIVHIALANLHASVTMQDFDAAAAYTGWQGALRKVFLASRADDDKQARFNEMVIRALRKADQVLAKKGRAVEERTIYVPRVAARNEWALRGKSISLERTIHELANMGVLTVDTTTNTEGKEVRDWERVQVMHQRVGCWCGIEHPKPDTEGGKP